MSKARVKELLEAEELNKMDIEFKKLENEMVRRPGLPYGFELVNGEMLPLYSLDTVLNKRILKRHRFIK